MEQLLSRQLCRSWLPHLALALASLLLLLPGASAGAVVKVALNEAAIQFALDTAAPGTAVILGAGMLVLSAPLVISTAGVSLIGAGPGITGTTLQSDSDTLPYLLEVGGSSPTLPTIIGGITFLNSAVPLNSPLSVTQPVGPWGAIQVGVSGPTGAQSVIQNCEFLNFFTSTGQPAAVSFDTFVSRWSIQGNRFEGLTNAIYMNMANSMVITGNTFTR